jgi:hypothetical protein
VHVAAAIPDILNIDADAVSQIFPRLRHPVDLLALQLNTEESLLPLAFFFAPDPLRTHAT